MVLQTCRLILMPFTRFSSVTHFINLFYLKGTLHMLTPCAWGITVCANRRSENAIPYNGTRSKRYKQASYPFLPKIGPQAYQLTIFNCNLAFSDTSKLTHLSPNYPAVLHRLVTTNCLHNVNRTYLASVLNTLLTSYR